ncbi:hypothetical protein B9Z65_9230 [Elsinoe australis]|uniref:Uncharacterized protein n=1 Tax=Elsinoe australis TaxID=40998 RepID=A0A2P7Z0V6_9PEZI|nr:hypothetical protein B9Z65_9230 [Elsinoe australis]
MQPLSVFSTLILLPSLASTACNSFSPSSSTPYTVPGTTLQASEGVVCDHGNTSCYVGDYRTNLNANLYPLNVPAGSFFSTSSTLNFSTPNTDIQSSLYTLIGDRTQITFYQIVWTNLTRAVGFNIGAGRAGYATYTPSMECINGTFEGCSGDGSPVNGTGVEACTPRVVRDCVSGGEFPCVIGAFSFKNTTEGEARDADWSPRTEVEGPKIVAWNERVDGRGTPQLAGSEAGRAGVSGRVAIVLALGAAVLLV